MPTGCINKTTIQYTITAFSIRTKAQTKFEFETEDGIIKIHDTKSVNAT